MSALFTLDSWLYRTQPSVSHRPFKEYTENSEFKSSSENIIYTPNQLRFNPFDIKEVDFVDSLWVVSAAGSPQLRNGMNILVYGFSKSMQNKALYNSDGDLLIGKTG